MARFGARGFSTLRHREFRLLAIGNMVSQMGTWQQYVAMLWLARELTDSAFLVTVVFAAQWVPFIVLSPFTGAVADRLDRRSLVLWGNVAMVLPAALLGALTQLDRINLVLLALLVVVGNSFQALTQPAASAFVPALVPPSEMHAAVALNMGMANSTRVIGPAIGGILVSRAGVEWGFYANAVSFLAVSIACLFVRTRSRPAGTQHDGYLSSVRLGLRYVRANRAATRLLLLLSAVPFFFVQAALLPNLVKDVLGGDAGTYGLLSSGPGVGFVVAAVLAVSITSDVVRIRLLFAAALGGSIAVFVVGMSRSVPLTFAALMLFGAAYMTLNTLASTLLLAASSDQYRGRVMAVFGMVSAGIFAVNAPPAGAVAKAVGVPTTIWASGLIAAGFSLAFVLSGMPGVIHRTLDRPPPSSCEPD